MTYKTTLTTLIKNEWKNSNHKYKQYEVWEKCEQGILYNRRRDKVVLGYVVELQEVKNEMP